MARQDQDRYGRDRNMNRDRQGDRGRGQSNRDQNESYYRGQRYNREQQQDRDYNRNRNDDWAREVPWERERGPYRDYGWERGESALPEFRDPSTHFQPYERERMSRDYDVDWNDEYGYGTARERGMGQMEEGPYSGVGPRNYQRSDERIMDEVCGILTRHGRIDASDVNVDVKNGEVTLSGSVRDRQMKRMAEDILDRVSGVKDVHNQLRVQQQNQWQGNQSGIPGGGRGRVDEVGGSGVYPASGPMPQGNAQVQGQASWGQGERGAEGYEDSGRSEISNQEQNKGKQRKS